MMARDLETDIDHLFQLPLDEFTAARNVLAKDSAGDAARHIKALSKPALPAWAVNQLYWRDNSTYNALVQAAERLRAAHRAVISGRDADIKRADTAHESAIREALKKTTTILNDAGGKASPAVLEAIRRTLEALPGKEQPGRLTRPLEPAGFEILKGLTPAPRSVPKRSRSEATRPERKAKDEKKAQQADSRQALARARKELATAERELRRVRQEQRKIGTAIETQTTKLEAAQADEERKREALERATEARQALEREIERLRFEARAAATSVAAAERGLETAQETLAAARSRS